MLQEAGRRAAQRDERARAKRGHGLVQNVLGGAIECPFTPQFPRANGRAMCAPRLAASPFHAADDPIASGGRERDELSARAAERKAMLVISPRRIRAEGRQREPTFHLRRLCAPRLRRAIRFRREPALDMPALVRKIFGNAPQFHAFSDHVAVRIAIGPAATDPGQPRASPYHAKIRFTEAIQTTSARDALLNPLGSFVRFSEYADQRSRPCATAGIFHATSATRRQRMFAIPWDNPSNFPQADFQAI